MINMCRIGNRNLVAKGMVADAYCEPRPGPECTYVYYGQHMACVRTPTGQSRHNMFLKPKRPNNQLSPLGRCDIPSAFRNHSETDRLSLFDWFSRDICRHGRPKRGNKPSVRPRVWWGYWALYLLKVWWEWKFVYTRRFCSDTYS